MTIAARSDMAKGASRVLIRLSQIFLVNMAFAAYVLENAIFFFSPGGAYICTLFKARLRGFCINSPASPCSVCSFSKEKWQMPDKCAGGMGTFGIDWSIITSHYTLGNYHPWRGLSPFTTLGITFVDFGLLHQCVEKSDLPSISALLHLFPLFPTDILV